MTVRCPFNGRSASSTSGLLAPAAQSSAGRATCSSLPWPAVLPQRPHRPRLFPPLARPCGDGSLTPPTEPVNPRSPLRAGFHCRVVPFLGLAVVLSAWRGQRGQGTTSIGRVLYVERLTAGSTATAHVFCDLPSKSLCQACWAANLSRRGELSFGWPRKWPISNEKWVLHF